MPTYDVTARVVTKRLLSIVADTEEEARNWSPEMIIDDQELEVIDWQTESVKEQNKEQ